MPITAICNLLIVLTTLFQFLLLFITLKHAELLRAFANRVISYVYRLWRYISLNSSRRPFPFAEFPAELSPRRLRSGSIAAMFSLAPENEYQPSFFRRKLGKICGRVE